MAIVPCGDDLEDFHRLERGFGAQIWPDCRDQLNLSRVLLELGECGKKGFVASARRTGLDEVRGVLHRELASQAFQLVQYEDAAVASAESALDSGSHKLVHGSYIGQIEIEVGSRLSIKTVDLPSSVLSALKRTEGRDRLQTIREQEGNKGYATGFEGLIQYISDQLPSNEEIGKARREEVKVYPELAIRDLVANMMIHQDFDISGTGPMVEIFEDRVEISNPGAPLIDPLRMMDHSPRSRNERLAYFMRRAKICEERGSGIDKVVGQAEVYQLPAPKFVREEQYFKATVFAPKTLRQMNKDDKIRACYQHCCLRYISNELMSNESLRGRFQISEENYSIASRIIADTVEAELIKPADPTNKSKKHSRYIPFWA